MVVLSILYLYASYYSIVDNNMLSLLLTLIVTFAAPLSLSYLLQMWVGFNGLWIAYGLSPVVALLVGMIFLRTVKKDYSFPYALPAPTRSIYNFDVLLSEQTVVDLRDQIEKILVQYSISRHTIHSIMLAIEELSLLVMEKNAGHTVCAEYSLSVGKEIRLTCRDDGIRFLCVTRFWMSTYCCGEGRYDFDGLDMGIRTLLARYPEAYIIFYFRNGVKVPDWWMKKHPDELCGFAVKLPGNKNDSSNWSNPDVPSIASLEYRKLQRDFIVALGKFARDRQWGRRIAGIHCGYGSSGDGMPAGCQALPDTGKRMTEAFRHYLTKVYGNDAALRKAWGDPDVTLGTAEVPDREARKGSGLWVRDLSEAKDRRLADYLECYHRVFSSFIIDFGKSVKEAFPGCLAGAYHGYTLLGYNSEGMTSRYREILQSPYIDYMWATVHGNSRTDGMSRHLISSFHRYGKLSSMEGDDRIYRAYLPRQLANTSLKPMSEVTNAASYHTPQESRSTMTKLMGNALIDGCGYQMVDFGKNGVKWFNCPEAREPLAASVAEWRRNWNDPPKPAADVAVVVDPDQIWKEGYSEEMYTHYLQGCLVDLARQSLNFSGYAVDTYVPEDFLDAKRNYRAVVFLNLYEADAALEAYPDMDKDNLFETGGSYGGFMTNWIIGHTDRFRACASQRSISNWFSFYGVSDIGSFFTCHNHNRFIAERYTVIQPCSENHYKSGRKEVDFHAPTHRFLNPICTEIRTSSMQRNEKRSCHLSRCHIIQNLICINKEKGTVAPTPFL